MLVSSSAQTCYKEDNKIKYKLQEGRHDHATHME